MQDRRRIGWAGLLGILLLSGSLGAREIPADVASFLVETADLSLERPDRSGLTAEIFLDVYVERWARRSGRPAIEVGREVDLFLAEARRDRDPVQRALAAFARGDFEQVERALGGEIARARREIERAVARGKTEHAVDSARRALDAQRLVTASRFAALDPRAALESAVEAAAILDALPAAAAARTAPWWIGVQRDLAIVQLELGVEATDAKVAEAHLRAAHLAIQEALLQLDRDADGDRWASAQTVLGRIRTALARWRPDRPAQRLFEEAVFAFDGALETRPPEADPELAALTLFHRAQPASQLGKGLQGSAEGERRMSEAVASLRGALEVWTADHAPQLWAGARNNLAGLLADLGLRDPSPGGGLLLAESIEIFRDLLARERAALKAGDGSVEQTTLLAGNLAWHLIQRGERATARGGDGEGAPYFNEAAVVYREALAMLDVGTAAEEWARFHHFLGIALRGQARGADEPARGDLLDASAAALREAAEVYAEVRPASALASLDSLARTLEAQGRFAEAAEVLKGILERAPDERDSLFRYRSLLQNELGDTAGALALMESWTRRNPGDLLASVYLVENLFLSGRYEECVARARVSAQDPRMLAPEQVVVRAFELAALRLLGRSSEEITARLDQLLAGVVEMPEVFSTRWTFPAVERSLRDKSATVHRDWLLDLFRTAGAENRSTLVEGLHRLRADLESQQI